MIDLIYHPSVVTITMDKAMVIENDLFQNAKHGNPITEDNLFYSDNILKSFVPW